MYLESLLWRGGVGARIEDRQRWTLGLLLDTRLTVGAGALWVGESINQWIYM